MGGRSGRTLFATATALALVVSSSGGAGSAIAADTCVGGSYAEPPPAAAYAEFPVVVIRVKWVEADSAKIQYAVTDSRSPVNDPFGSHSVAMDAGCNGQAVVCGPVAPLILSDATHSGRNQAPLWAGQYTIVAAPGGACVYPTGEDGKPEYATAPKEVTVTATIEYYRAGEQAPSFSKTLAPVMVPTLEVPPVERSSYRRILGTFRWDPAAGISNAHDAPVHAGEATSSPPGRETMRRMLKSLGPGGTLLVLLLIRAGGMADARKGRAFSVDRLADWYAEGVAIAILDVVAIAGADTGPTPPPAQPPPPAKMPKGDLVTFHRWVYVSEPVRVADDPGGDVGLKKLKAGRWYQGKKLRNGSWQIRRTDGRLIGWTSPIDEERVWRGPPASE